MILRQSAFAFLPSYSAALLILLSPLPAPACYITYTPTSANCYSALAISPPATALPLRAPTRLHLIFNLTVTTTTTKTAAALL